MQLLEPHTPIRRAPLRIRRTLPRTWAALFFLSLLALVPSACGSAPPARPPARSVGVEIPAAVAHPPREAPIDVEHYALDIDLDPAARSLHATCRIRFVARVDALKDVTLDFVGLEARSVRGPHSSALTFEQSAGALHVTLPRALARGEPIEIAIEYAGQPKKGLWFAGERDGVPTQVFTQGECEDARWWFPCVDRPSERATSEIRVTMPKTWIAVAAGDRLDRVEMGDRAVEHWRMTTPHPAYLTTLVAGELATKRAAWEGVPLDYLATSRYASGLDASFADTGEVLGFLSAITGRRYPYVKYSQACVDNFPFGGMENISATTLTDNTLQDARGHRDAPSTGLVAHEAAHQWFGDLLTCKEWAHIWLNEGFATYCTALFTEHQLGVDEMRVALRDIQESYVANDVGDKRRPTVCDVYRDPIDLFFTGQTYQGGAARLHLLRFVLGDDAFFRGLKLYVGRNAGRGVVTDDFRRALEEVAKTDLGWFFEQWFEKPGFPEFQVTWKYDPGRKQALLSVNQVQTVADGTPSAFRSPLDVEVRDSQGTRIVRVEIERRRHLFEIPSPEEPIWVRFDAHGWIPKIVDDKKTTREWLAIGAECDDVNARRDAVRVIGRDWELTNGEQERKRISTVLFDRLANDTCGAVRAAAATALATVRRPEARARLCDAAAKDPEVRVRVAALEALKAFAAEPDLADFALEQYRAGYSWNTMAAAAGLYRRARPAGAFEFLQVELAVPSPHGQLKAKLIGEIADLRQGSGEDSPRDPRALPLIASIAADEREEEGARVAAAGALGRIGRGNADVRQELTGLLGTRLWRLRRETIAALIALDDEAALGVLEAYYRRTIFPSERRAIEVALKRASLAG